MSPSVLVVEDYADLRSAIVTALSRDEYTCDDVSNAAAAIEMLRGHHYQTILLSPTLPIIDDPVMHYLALHQPQELQNVVLMTNPEVDDVATPDELRVLAKPFNHEQLLAKLATR